MKQNGQLTIVQVEEEYHEIYKGEELVGNATLYIYPEHIAVDNMEFEEVHQGKGYGKEIVEQLKTYPGITALTGDSVPEALPFWAKMGAIFDYGELDALEEEGDALVGFEISWNNR